MGGSSKRDVFLTTSVSASNEARAASTVAGTDDNGAVVYTDAAAHQQQLAAMLAQASLYGSDTPPYVLLPYHFTPPTAMIMQSSLVGAPYGYYTQQQMQQILVSTPPLHTGYADVHFNSTMALAASANAMTPVPDSNKGNGDALKTTNSAAEKSISDEQRDRIRRFFNNGFSHYDDSCLYIAPSKQPTDNRLKRVSSDDNIGRYGVCRFRMSPKGCKYGPSCRFLHENDSQSVPASLNQSSSSTTVDSVNDDNLYLSNMPIHFDEESLTKMLSEFGEVVSCRILRDKVGVSRSIGFARMGSHEACENAILKLDSSTLPGCMELLRCRYATNAYQPDPNSHSFCQCKMTESLDGDEPSLQSDISINSISPEFKDSKNTFSSSECRFCGKLRHRPSRVVDKSLLVEEIFSVAPDLMGLVIGKNGNNIRRAEAIQGVYNVQANKSGGNASGSSVRIVARTAEAVRQARAILEFIQEDFVLSSADTELLFPGRDECRIRTLAERAVLFRATATWNSDGGLLLDLRGRRESIDAFKFMTSCLLRL